MLYGILYWLKLSGHPPRCPWAIGCERDVSGLSQPIMCRSRAPPCIVQCPDKLILQGASILILPTKIGTKSPERVIHHRRSLVRRHNSTSPG